MAVHPLRPATDRRFGGPLPRQLANQTRIHLVPINLFTQCHAASCAYAVLPAVSSCYSPVRGRLSTRYSPVRHYDEIHPKISIITVRLACVRHAASVHPEPGSNSHVKNEHPVINGMLKSSSILVRSTSAYFLRNLLRSSFRNLLGLVRSNFFTLKFILNFFFSPQTRCLKPLLN